LKIGYDCAKERTERVISSSLQQTRVVIASKQIFGVIPPIFNPTQPRGSVESNPDLIPPVHNQFTLLKDASRGYLFSNKADAIKVTAAGTTFKSFTHMRAKTMKLFGKEERESPNLGR
jgi:hypothetical protein